MTMEQERQISVIEAPPFSRDYGRRRFFMASSQEREEMKGQFPLLIVREATAEEVDGLKGKTWEEREKEEINRLLVENGYASN